MSGASNARNDNIWRIVRNIRIIIAGLLGVALGAGVLNAQDPPKKPGELKLRDFHGWGRFPAGSWRRVRVTKETFDEKGEIASVSVTDARTTLEMAANHSFELRTESTIEVAGQRYVPAPQKSKRDYYGIPREANIKLVRESEFVLNGLKKKCGVYEVIVNRDASKRVTRFHVAANAPLILRQETTATSKDGQKQFEINVDVVAIDMPMKVLADTMPCAYLRTVQETTDKRIITIETYAKAVPGGVVSQSVRVLDNKTGKMTERQTAELVDYGRVPVKPASTFPPARRRLGRPRR